MNSYELGVAIETGEPCVMPIAASFFWKDNTSATRSSYVTVNTGMLVEREGTIIATELPAPWMADCKVDLDAAILSVSVAYKASIQ